MVITHFPNAYVIIKDTPNKCQIVLFDGECLSKAIFIGSESECLLELLKIENRIGKYNSACYSV